MQLSIEPNNGIPIYEQLVRQIKYAVAEGVVVPGQVIPSVREMARQLAVNPNTVQRAYLQLQDEEVLHSFAEPKGRLKAVIQLQKKDALVQGPSLHEICHQWANDIVTRKIDQNSPVRP